MRWILPVCVLFNVFSFKLKDPLSFVLESSWANLAREEQNQTLVDETIANLEALQADSISWFNATIETLRSGRGFFSNATSTPSVKDCEIDFNFNGDNLDANKCPKGWICSKDYADSGGGCGAYDGVFVGLYVGVLNTCNGCMTPGSRKDDYFFKIAWDNQCGYATSDSFYLPDQVDSVKFSFGGGADLGGIWVYRKSDDAILCSKVAPPTCPMIYEKCQFTEDYAGTEVYIKLEKPCSGSGGWENLVFDELSLLDSDDNDISSSMTCRA